MFILRVTAACGLCIAVPAHAETLVALVSPNRLVTFDHAAPQAITSAVIVTGLAPDESLLGIDFRPRTGALYGLGSGSHLYVIDPNTGSATRVGPPGGFTLNFGPQRSDPPSFGFDFDPVSDSIRIVSNTGQNILLDADDGTVLAVDSIPTYAPGDRAYQPSSPFVDPEAIAYTNSFPGAQSTLLYDIDVQFGALLTQDPPEGTNAVRTVGYLGFAGQKSSGVRGRAGFDISGRSGTAYAALLTSESHQLCTIDLSTGGATVLGRIGAPETVPAESVVALAAPTASQLTVTTTADAGPGSLRQAILDANTSPGADRIVFNIPGAGVQRIEVGSNPLPAITGALTIDGYTQPGAAANSLTIGSNARILIEIRRNHSPNESREDNYDGLVLNASGCTIRGLSLTGFRIGGGFKDVAKGVGILAGGAGGT
ncbi:MAG TPA: DUF4394 domain-containing protein [Chthoniobacterales bacterium]|nr:DUF4394 domain-containing protein [Chthoniobacterales bacterium]